ncbi:MAG TPA: hypothetical protein VIR63_04995 [Pontiella sp.]
MSVNQAVLFTKPVHHLGIDLSPDALNELTRSFFESRGVQFILSKEVSGAELESRGIIREHYLMYSKASLAETIKVSDSGKQVFKETFGKSWNSELANGRILPTSRLLLESGLSKHKLYQLWSREFLSGHTVKLEDGIIVGYLSEFDVYCINAFYPAMEENFYHPNTRIYYHVVEFDSAQISWKTFRKNMLGETNASKAVLGSFRGQLYARYPVDFPGRDNFAHCSAGPLEALIERSIHEVDFDMNTNPIGCFLLERGVDLAYFKAWKENQPIKAIGALFDQTEEKNTDEVVQILSALSW